MLLLKKEWISGSVSLLASQNPSDAESHDLSRKQVVSGSLFSIRVLIDPEAHAWKAH